MLAPHGSLGAVHPHRHRAQEGVEIEPLERSRVGNVSEVYG